MSESHRQGKNNSALAAWLSFVAVLVFFLGAGGVVAARVLLSALGIDADVPLTRGAAISLIAALILTLPVLVYLGSVFWLVFARLFFTRSVAAKVAFAGPTTRFDRWLFNRVYPRDATRDDG